MFSRNSEMLAWRLDKCLGDSAPVDFRGIPGPEVLGTEGTPRFVTLRLKP
jgi:hypothetical protein